MPITPREAAAKSSTQIESLVSAHEQIFDAALAATYTGSGRVIVYGSQCPSIPSHIREKVRKQLKSLYNDAGWSLQYKDCQRDGDWWEIAAIARVYDRKTLKEIGRGGYGSYDQEALNKHGR